MSSEEINKLIDILENEFVKNSNKEKSLGMSKYMKNKFTFFGVNSPGRKEIQRKWISDLPKDLSKEERWEIVEKLWEKEEREFQYVAIDWLNGWNKKIISAGDSEKLEWLITNKSWWDSVDSIASNYLGAYCRKYPVEASELVEDWRHADNMWLNRSCLIFQLKYSDKVDFELLKSLIVQYQNVKEFFIQKAIGWSLRQYSKFNPEGVRKFVDQLKLTGLAKKEATKYI